NFVTVEYLRDLTAIEDTIAFDYDGFGAVQFEIDGFSTGQANRILAWEVGDRYAPQKLTAQYISGSGPNHSYRVGVGLNDSHRFYVTTENQIKTPKAIEAYAAQPVEPASGGAQWLAISHADFISEAERLAIHRASTSGLTTHVVDVADVVAQYGYGFSSSQAIKRYIEHAYTEWSTPVEYVVLVGDAHFNPRLLDCSQCLKDPDRNFFDFGITTESFVPVVHAYADDFQGLISSDYDYSLLSGDDLVPEIGIGRLSVETLAEAGNAVDKIILYEENLEADAAWQKELLFLHDLSKANEPFENQSIEAAVDVPDSLNVTIDGFQSVNDAVALRTRTFSNLADGVGILMWRGHGSVDTWSNSAHQVLSYNDIAGLDPLIINDNRPFVSISFDCLDGHFAIPGFNSISESLLRMDRGRGAAAHFSSSGLGFISDHAVLSETMINAMYSQGLTTIGDAINYTKYVYLDAVTDRSELYSFNLQGDPAMLLYITDLSNFSGQASVSSTQAVAAGDPLTFTYQFENSSSLAASSRTRLEITLPADLSYSNLTTSVESRNVTVTTAELEDGSTRVIVNFNNGDLPAAGGGIFANTAVTIELEAEVRENPTKSLGTVDATLSAPGVKAATSSHAVNFGNNELIFLPFVPSN
ncbi:MAG: C25 family cysteine peptidase, partial [Chloroflexota bacterium]